MHKFLFGRVSGFSGLMLIGILFIPGVVYAQATMSTQTPMGTNSVLYYSAQNGGKSTVSGSLTITKSDALYEHGSATLGSTGPITYAVSPAALSMAVGNPMSKTWSGSVTVNQATAPPAGSSAPAVMFGDYDIFYSCPVPCYTPGTPVGDTWLCDGSPSTPCFAGHTAPSEHQLVEEGGTDTANLTVYSIKVKIAGPPVVCMRDTVVYTATQFPATGGSIAWTITNIGIGTGNVTWMTPKTGNTIKIVANDRNYLVQAVFTIGGVSYMDTMTTTIYSTAWAVGYTPPSADLTKLMQKLEYFKKICDYSKKWIPTNKIDCKGPDISFNGKARNCCANNVTTTNGERQYIGTIKAGLYASNIPIGVLPWSGCLPDINGSIAGFGTKLSVCWGVLFSCGAEINGTFGYKFNDCVPESCFTGSLGLNVPVTLALKAEYSVCLLTWWGDICNGSSITPAAISTNFYGQLTYNNANCSEGFRAAVGMGPVNLTASISVGGFGWDYTYTVFSGGELFHIP